MSRRTDTDIIKSSWTSKKTIKKKEISRHSSFERIASLRKIFLRTLDLPTYFHFFSIQRKRRWVCLQSLLCFVHVSKLTKGSNQNREDLISLPSKNKSTSTTRVLRWKLPQKTSENSNKFISLFSNLSIFCTTSWTFNG